MENVKVSFNCEWHDNDMFVIHFAPCPSDKDFGMEGVTEEVIMSYHKSLDMWSVDKLYLDGDGNYVDYESDAFSQSEREKYIRFGETEILNFNNLFAQRIYG